jgi:hypothetical protein
MANLNEIKLRMEEDIKTAFQYVIEQEGLVDTGLLRDTIEVNISDDFEIEINAQEYYTYLDEGTKYIQPYNITDKVLESPYFQRVLEYYEEAFAQIIEDNLNNQ